MHIYTLYVKSLISKLKWTGKEGDKLNLADPQEKQRPYKTLMDYRNTEFQGIRTSA